MVVNATSVPAGVTASTSRAAGGSRPNHTSRQPASVRAATICSGSGTSARSTSATNVTPAVAAAATAPAAESTSLGVVPPTLHHVAAGLASVSRHANVLRACASTGMAAVTAWGSAATAAVTRTVP